MFVTVVAAQVDSNAVRCPDGPAAAQMHEHILALKRDKDSTGGVIRCVARRVPVGLGEPCFDKLEARERKREGARVLTHLSFLS